MTGGRCHGPDCTQPAVVEFWCSEACKLAWDRQAAGLPATKSAPVPPLPTPTEVVIEGRVWSYRAEPVPAVDIEAVRTLERQVAEAIDGAARFVAGVLSEPRFATGGFIGPPRDPSVDRIPAVLSEGGCLPFWRGDHSGNHREDEQSEPEGAASAQVAPVPISNKGWSGAFHWLFGRTS